MKEIKHKLNTRKYNNAPVLDHERLRLEEIFCDYKNTHGLSSGVKYDEYIRNPSRERIFRDLKIQIISEYLSKGYTYNRIGILMGVKHCAIVYYVKKYIRTDTNIKV